MRYSVLLFILLLVVSSGCTQEKGSGISVNRIDVQPQEILEGSEVGVTVEATNTGLLEGTVFPGEQGKNIMTNYCPDYFEIKEDEFKLRSTRQGENDGEGIKLAEGDSIKLFWRLNQYEESNKIALPGYKCPLRFELPFNYSTRTFKQIQVLEDNKVETDAKLQSQVSKGPLGFDMELIGTTSSKKNTFYQDEDVSLYITSYNREEVEDSKYRGVVELSDVELETRGPIEIEDNDCIGKGQAVLAAGEEKIYRCNIIVKRDGENSYGPPSSRGEIAARVNYTYIRDLGSREVKVNPDAQ